MALAHCYACGQDFEVRDRFDLAKHDCPKGPRSWEEAEEVIRRIYPEEKTPKPEDKPS